MFDPIANYSTVTLMLPFAAQKGLKMLLLDVKAAFLNAERDKTIFMEQPEGYIIKGRERMVYQLLKAIYDFKQASRTWRKLIIHSSNLWVLKQIRNSSDTIDYCREECSYIYSSRNMTQAGFI